MALSFRKPTRTFVAVTTFLLLWHGAAAAAYVAPGTDIIELTPLSVEDVMFAVAIASGLVAAIFLRLRKRLATALFAVSVGAGVVSTAIGVVTGHIWSLGGLLPLAAVMAVGLAAVSFSRWQTRVGLLR